MIDDVTRNSIFKLDWFEDGMPYQIFGSPVHEKEIEKAVDALNEMGSM